MLHYNCIEITAAVSTQAAHDALRIGWEDTSLAEQNNPISSISAAPSGGRHAAPTGKRRTSLIVLGAVLGLCVLLCAAGVGWLIFYGNIYPGVSISGLDASGMTRAELMSALGKRFETDLHADVLTLQIGDETLQFDASSADARFDAAGSVLAAYSYGRSGSLFARAAAVWHAWRQGVDLSPAVSVDEAQLRARVAELVARFDRPAVDPSFTLRDNRLFLDRGEAGRTIHPDELTRLILDHILTGSATPLVFEPQVTQPASLDLNDLKTKLERPVREATLDLVADPKGGVIIPAEPGITFDVAAAQRVLDAAADSRTVELPVTLEQPKLTTEEFQSALFRDELAAASTPFNASLIGRSINVRLATEHCNGVILNPGDTFSYNQTVGPRTYERGFQDAIVYVGATAEDGVGGGICQVSSTIYYAALRADLEIVERSAHSRMVTYVPLGEDATVAWGSKDFRFKNNTDYPIRIDTTAGKSSIKIHLIGTKTSDKVVKMETKVHKTTPFGVQYVLNPTLPLGTEKVKSNGYTGYSTETWRVVYENGKEISRTLENKSVYKMYDKIIEHNPKPTEPTKPVDATTAPPATTTTTAGTTATTTTATTTTSATEPTTAETTPPTEAPGE